MPSLRRRLSWLPALACLAAATGCSTYTIHGTAIHGAVSDMEFVPRNDPRLGDPPLANVRITVQRDPDKLSRHMVGTDLTDAHGRFVIPLDEFGTGWMEEEWLIRASKNGFRTASGMVRLGSSTKDQRLLIILAPGVSIVPSDDEELLEEYERYR